MSITAAVLPSPKINTRCPRYSFFCLYCLFHHACLIVCWLVSLFDFHWSFSVASLFPRGITFTCFLWFLSFFSSFVVLFVNVTALAGLVARVCMLSYTFRIQHQVMVVLLRWLRPPVTIAGAALQWRVPISLLLCCGILATTQLVVWTSPGWKIGTDTF